MSHARPVPRALAVLVLLPLPALLPAALVSGEEGELFQEALHLEKLRGDLPAAAELYRKIAESDATPPAEAARARLRLATCLEESGRTEEAVEVLLAVLARDRDELPVVRIALERLRRHQERAEERLAAGEEVRRAELAKEELARQLGELEAKYRAALSDLEASQESRDSLAREIAEKESALRETAVRIEEEKAALREEGGEPEGVDLVDRARGTLDRLAARERVRLEQGERVVVYLEEEAARLEREGRLPEAASRLEEAIRLAPADRELRTRRDEIRARAQGAQPDRGAPSPGREAEGAVLGIHETRPVREAFERAFRSVRLPDDVEVPGSGDPAFQGTLRKAGVEEVGLSREEFDSWLVGRIESGVRPGTWSEPERQIVLAGDDLLVRREPAVQQEVAALLSSLAEPLFFRAKILLVRVQALFYGPRFLEEATRDWNLAETGTETGLAPTGSVLRAVLDPEREAALLSRARSTARACLVPAAPLVLLEGQSGSVSLLSHTVAITDYEKRKVGDEFASRPVVERLAEGIVLRLIPAPGPGGPEIQGHMRSTRLIRPLSGVSTAAGTNQIAAYLEQKAEFEIPVTPDRTHLLLGLANPFADGDFMGRTGRAGGTERLPHLALLVSTRALSPEPDAGGASPPEGPGRPEGSLLRAHAVADLLGAEDADFLVESPPGGALSSPEPPIEGPAADLADAVRSFVAGDGIRVEPAGDSLAVEGPPEVHAQVARILSALRSGPAAPARISLVAYALESELHDAFFRERGAGDLPLVVLGREDAERAFAAWDPSRALFEYLREVRASPGRLATLSRVTFERYVAGFDVVREEGGAGGGGQERLVPREATAAEGIAIALRIFRPLPEGATHVTLSLWMGENLGDERTLFPGGLEAFTPRPSIHRGLWRSVVPAGSWIVLGGLPAGPAGGTPDSEDSKRRLVLALSPEEDK
ncbi:MAG: tetratricopeptide repeat protein [Planctomycetes bacterium]|nr:tetratricopeptide repeat protein [Planctomycetota bacterium]